jgi:hypothetical protein
MVTTNPQKSTYSSQTYQPAIEVGDENGAENQAVVQTIPDTGSMETNLNVKDQQEKQADQPKTAIGLVVEKSEPTIDKNPVQTKISNRGLFLGVSMFLVVTFGIGVVTLYSFVLLPQMVRLSLSHNIDIYNKITDTLKTTTDGILSLTALQSKDAESTNKILTDLGQKIPSLDDLQNQIKNDQGRLDSGLNSDTIGFKNDVNDALEQKLKYTKVLKNQLTFQVCLLNKYWEVKSKLELQSQKINSLGVGASNDELTRSYDELAKAADDSGSAIQQTSACYQTANYEMSRDIQDKVEKDTKLMENLANNARLAVDGIKQNDFAKFRTGSETVAKISDKNLVFLAYDEFNKALQTNSAEVATSREDVERSEQNLQAKLQELKEKYKF